MLFPIALASTTQWLPTQPVLKTNEEVKAFASTTFAGTPLMNVCRCESTDRQWNTDGYILQGKVNHNDLGFCQINSTYHFAEAYKLGYDIMTPEGNIGFAKYLYDKEGTQPWSASRACWDVDNRT